MKWILVVLVGGVSPLNTKLVFDKFSDCLSAEEQMRQHYADAFDAWDRLAAAKIDRRRDYERARDLEAKRLLANMGTCIYCFLNSLVIRRSISCLSSALDHFS
jgi:hypothetical protein